MTSPNKRSGPRKEKLAAEIFFYFPDFTTVNRDDRGSNLYVCVHFLKLAMKARFQSKT